MLNEIRVVMKQMPLGLQEIALSRKKERKSQWWGLQAGLHWWKPRPSGRTQSSLMREVFFLSVVGDGEYVAGVAPALPAITQRR